MNKIEELEIALITAMLNDIAATNDPIEQYRAIERYAKFVEARCKRVNVDGLPMPVKKKS